MAGNTRSITPGLEIKGLNEVFAKEYDKKVVGRVKSEDVFNIDTQTIGMSETDLALAAVGEFQATAEQKNINKDKVLERGQTLYEHAVYTNGITQSYQQWLADETGKNMVQRVSQLAKAARESQDKKRFGVLRDNPTVLDGQNLFSTAHPLADGSTQSNDISYATSLYDTVKAMMKALGDQTQFQGDLAIPVDPKMILLLPLLISEYIASRCVSLFAS